MTQYNSTWLRQSVLEARLCKGCRLLLLILWFSKHVRVHKAVQIAQTVYTPASSLLEVSKSKRSLIEKLELFFGGSRIRTYSITISERFPTSSGSIPDSWLLSRLRKLRSSVVRQTGRVPSNELSLRSLWRKIQQRLSPTESFNLFLRRFRMLEASIQDPAVSNINFRIIL